MHEILEIPPSPVQPDLFEPCVVTDTSHVYTYVYVHVRCHVALQVSMHQHVGAEGNSV